MSTRPPRIRPQAAAAPADQPSASASQPPVTRSDAPQPAPPAAPAQVPPGATARFRSGAVARMLRMPVATLRIWERRYQVSSAETSAAGHRLYSAADVQRLALLRQLADLGHAIGALAGLDMAQLQQVASTHASTLAQARQSPAATPAPSWRVVVVGQALARRLQAPGLARRLGRPLQLLQVHAELSEATLASALGGAGAQGVDALLCQAPGLDAQWPEALQRAAAASQARQVGLLYGFAPEAVCQALLGQGVSLLREPQSEQGLAHWLNGLMAPVAAPPSSRAAATGGGGSAGEAAPVRQAPAELSWLITSEVPPRRYDDATLADLAGLSTTIACECPRHVAEILMQLSHFEAYSAECVQRSPADASLHAHLQQVAAASRALFETALERLAIHEGLMLPR